MTIGSDTARNTSGTSKDKTEGTIRVSCERARPHMSRVTRQGRTTFMHSHVSNLQRKWNKRVVFNKTAG